MKLRFPVENRKSYVILLLLVACISVEAPPPSPADRTLEFLKREVEDWRGENGCYSCHNNGDAARALYQAAARRAQPDPIVDTTNWLRQPDAWQHNGGEGPMVDYRLANLQFALALVTADQSGLLEDQTALTSSAELVAADQDEEGAWQTHTVGIGSPITYGPALGTVLALDVLTHVDPQRFAPAISRGTTFLAEFRVQTVLDAAGILLGPVDREEECLAVLRRGRTPDGGWGPFVNSAPEVFDTALVLLALTHVPHTTETTTWIAGARRFLIEAQQGDGSFLATTRPSGLHSYAHEISTSGWAAQALLATDPESR